MRRTATFFFLWVFFAGIILSMFGLTYWYWQVRRESVHITVETQILVGPRDPITIHFSQSVRPDSFFGQIQLQPKQPVRTEWHAHNQELWLIPEENWPLESHFQLSVGPGKTLWWGATPLTRFRFSGPSYPTITQFFPQADAHDVLLGIEDPLKVSFNTSVKDFFIDFRLDPKVDVVYQNNADKTVFDILPKKELPAGTKHTLSVYAKWRGDPDARYQFLGDTTFVTQAKAPMVLRPNLATRAEEAKRVTLARIADGKYIDINLENQVMTLFENGQAIDAYTISSGKRGMETPRGEFAVHNKAPRPWSKAYGLYMPFWQAITADGKVGIHELPEWPGGYKEGANHLGTPVSHGCVRLGIGPAERVYNWSEIGTPIVIY